MVFEWEFTDESVTTEVDLNAVSAVAFLVDFYQQFQKLNHIKIFRSQHTK